jgi:hypothetical protein
MASAAQKRGKTQAFTTETQRKPKPNEINRNVEVFHLILRTSK